MTTTAAPSHILGRHIWSELMTTDVNGAKAFYGAVVGWTSEPMRGGAMPYTRFKRNHDTGVAGLMEQPPGMNMPPFWSMYIAVPDFAAAAAHITRLGGSGLSGVIDMPAVGRMQMLKDPQGAAFYIMQPEPRDNPPVRDPQPGDACWLELMTTDAHAAMSFYNEIFGWEEAEAMDMGPAGTYHVFARGGRRMGGMMNQPAAMAQMPPLWGIYFEVPDVVAAAARVAEHGGRVLNGPQEVPGGAIVNAIDPVGAAFSLHTRKPS
jgi:predicted enzyme related to lactoylglutathione lyase